jgi:hypothetical protein
MRVWTRWLQTPSMSLPLFATLSDESAKLIQFESARLLLVPIHLRPPFALDPSPSQLKEGAVSSP